MVVISLGSGNGARHELIPGLPFKDSDDVMRMLQVLALRDGGDWYDLTHRQLAIPTYSSFRRVGRKGFEASVRTPSPQPSPARGEGARESVA